MKRNVIVGLVVGLLLFSLACGAVSGTPDPTAVDTQPVQSGLAIEISNQSPYEICYVQISGADQEDWGDDQLGEGETIAAGASKSFSMPAGAYDVKTMTCSQATLGTFWAISSSTTVEVGGRGLVPLVVLNESSTEICYVFIAPSTEDSWGEDWLGQSESLMPQEGARIFFTKPGTYDMLVQDCEANDLITEVEVALTEEVTWTITD